MKTIDTLPVMPFRHLVATIGELPTNFVESMSYYELLAWLCDYVQKTIIPAVNNNAEAIKEIQNWISTLDLQDEVDNKLDEMAESGELADIIAQYLGLAGVLAFDTLAGLIAAQNIAEGSTCRTLGRLNYLDGQGAYYKIRKITSGDVVDGVNIIAVDKDDTLIAELIPATTFKGIQYAPFDVYVDGTNGDDDNAGTAASPLKTINAAIEKFGNQLMYGEFRIQLTTGSYDFNVFNMSNISLHIGHDSNDATTGVTTINMINPNTDKYDNAFYCCHINFVGTTNNPFVVNYTNSDGMYFDGCTTVATHTTFNGRFTLYGGEGSFDYCTINSLKLRGASAFVLRSNIGFIDVDSSKLHLWQCTYDTTVDATAYVSDQPDTLIYGRNSDLIIFGTSVVHYDGTPTITNFFQLEGGNLSLQAALNVKTGDVLAEFTGAITFNASTIRTTAARYTALVQHATTVTLGSDCITSAGITG